MAADACKYSTHQSIHIAVCCSQCSLLQFSDISPNQNVTAGGISLQTICVGDNDYDNYTYGPDMLQSWMTWVCPTGQTLVPC